MRPRYSPHHAREVNRQSFAQYNEYFEFYSSVARKSMYKYESPPWVDRPPYDIWLDEASHLDLANAPVMLDMGYGEGDFYGTVGSRGFNGKYIGVDKYVDPYIISDRIVAEFPNADVELIKADAQDLTEIFPDSSIPLITANFIGYHVDYPDDILSEIYRIGQPNAQVAMSSREVDNMIELWNFAREAAFFNGFAFPQELDQSTRPPKRKRAPTEEITFYAHFPLERLFGILNRDKRFKVEHQSPQFGQLYVPLTNEGWEDTVWATGSFLSHTINVETAVEATKEDVDRMKAWIASSHLYDRFKHRAIYNQKVQNTEMPYFDITVHQGFSIFRLIK